MEELNKYKGWIFLGVAFVIISSVYGATAGTYNDLVKERAEARLQYSQIETQMQRRADLVPNIVGATKGAMSQEKAVFENISKAHAAFQNAPSGTGEKLQAGDNLATALRGYLVVAQQYPQLRSLDIIKDLTITLEGTENRISVSRQRYNEAVRDYNQHLEMFPTNILNGFYRFEPMQAFETNKKGKEVPNVIL